MKILHLSDYHYKAPSYSKFDNDKILDKFLENLKEKGVIDFVFFTGDLVHKGDNAEHFNEAKEFFLDKILNSINVKQNNFFICAGNHDVDRSTTLESLNTFFSEKITSNELLNSFVTTTGGKDYVNSLESTSNYFIFINRLYKNSPDIISNLYTIHKRKIEKKQIGIVSLNSAWRSYGKEDYGNLLIPEKTIKEALEQIGDCPFKILLVHHPLYYLKEFNFMEVQNLVHGSFNMIFSGHIHNGSISSHYVSNNGIFAHVSPAALTYEEGKSLGYSIIDYDFECDDIVKINRVFYLKKESIFHVEEPIPLSIPCGIEKDKQNHLRKKVLGKYEMELQNANDLLLDYRDSSERNFLDYFTSPVLKTKSNTEISSPDTNLKFEFEEILNNDRNYLIFGLDKSGKSSILKKIQLDHLKYYIQKGLIPFYIDCKEIENKINENFDFVNVISKYYELNNSQTVEMLSKRGFRLLIDNFNPEFSQPLTNKLRQFLFKYPKIGYVICSMHTISRSIEDYDIGPIHYTKLFLHDLTRKEIRSYSNKWNALEKADKNEVIEKIEKLCKQLELPFNYWSISLLLLIHKKSNYDSSKNLFEILDLCVDEIFNKRVLSLTRSRISFLQLKKLCSELAHHLLIQYSKNTYSIPDIELRNFIDNYIKNNPRLTAQSGEVYDYLISSGILKLKDDNCLTFRLNGLFEYFLAYYVNQNPEFKNEILTDDRIYLAFKNELEIYSGFKRDDKEFLIDIFSKTKDFFKEINQYYESLGNPDDILISKTIEVNELLEIAKKFKILEPYSYDLQDQIKDDFMPIGNYASEVHVKEIYNVNKLSVDIFERYLSILARVFRNSDEIKEHDLIRDVFDFLLDTYCNFGFYLMTDIERDVKKIFNGKVSTDKEINILQLISMFTPIITQTSLFDGIGHFNIENIVLNKLEQLKKKPKTNQFKIFLLYFLLMDIDFRKNKKYIDDLLSIIKIGALKTSIVMKLYYYFTFKATNNKEYEIFLRNKIQEAQLNLNSKNDKGEIHKKLEGIKKTKLYNK